MPAKIPGGNKTRCYQKMVTREQIAYEVHIGACTVIGIVNSRKENRS